jgi:hypothetical protein
MSQMLDFAKFKSGIKPVKSRLLGAWRKTKKLSAE